MIQLLHYFGRFQQARGNFGSLPSWARAIVFFLALPGIVLILLSIVVFVVSLLALLLLTVPAYRLLKAVTTRPATESPGVSEPANPNRKSVEVTIIE